MLTLFQLLFVVDLSIRAQTHHEFNGPFKSWANVKLRFGAKGNGIADDTRSIQKAIDALTDVNDPRRTKSSYSVLYLPEGTYCISSTLVLKGKIGVSVIGENPSSTVIKWIGKAGDTIIWANGSAFFKISRITLNANNTQEMKGIGIHWKERWDDQYSRSYAPLNIEISDCYFSGKFQHGISGGTSPQWGTGNNDSEIAVLRCRFAECEKGIDIHGYNALDYWVWDCRFLQCEVGISNAYGNYHAYRCYFEGSREADIINDNGYYTSVRGCYSLHSNHFSIDRGASCNPFKRIFQLNQVKPLKGNSIYFAHIGKPVFLDNVFAKGRNLNGDYTLHYSSWCSGIYQVLSMGNKYALGDPLEVAVPRKTIFSIKDTYKYLGELPLSKESFLATQEALPTKITRTVLEVPQDASSVEIQKLINQASRLKGTKPIIHFGFGSYLINDQLLIPADSDIQLIGDGLIYASILRKSGNFPKGKSMLRIAGPTNVVLKDLQIADHDGSPNIINAIEFLNVDQPGSTAFIDQLYTPATSSIELNGLDYLYVQKQNSFFSTGNRVTGGKLIRQERGTAGLYCFGGQFADLTVDGNGRFVSKDCWWEGARRKPIDISGSGQITLDGIMIAPNGADSGETVAVNNFNGNISVMNAYIQGGVLVKPDNPGLKILLWNIHFYHKMNPTQFISSNSRFKGAFLGLTTQCFDSKNPDCDKIISLNDKVVQVSDEKAFLQEMVQQDRTSMPKHYSGKQLGASSILISRVSVGNTNVAIRFVK